MNPKAKLIIAAAVIALLLIIAAIAWKNYQFARCASQYGQMASIIC